MRLTTCVAVLAACAAEAAATVPASGPAATKAHFEAVAALRPVRNERCGVGEADRWAPYRKALEALAGKAGAGATALTLVADAGENVSLTALDVITRLKPVGGEKVLFDALPPALAKPRTWPCPSKGLAAEAALPALAAYRSPLAADLLARLLPNQEWRRQIIEVIAVTEQPRAAAHVVGYLDDPQLADAVLMACLRLGDGAMAPRVKTYCEKLAGGQAVGPNAEVRRQQLQKAAAALWALDRRGEFFDFIGETLERHKLSLSEEWPAREFFRPDILPARVMELYHKADWSPRHRLSLEFITQAFGTAHGGGPADGYETWPQRYARVGNEVFPLLLACVERGDPVTAREALRAMAKRALHTTADQKAKVRQLLHRLATGPAPRPIYLAQCLTAYADAATPALLAHIADQDAPDRVEAASHLMALDRPAALAALRKMLDSTDTHTRRGAAYRLAFEGETAGVGILLEAATAEVPSAALNYARAIATALNLPLDENRLRTDRPAELARLRAAWQASASRPGKAK